MTYPKAVSRRTLHRPSTYICTFRECRFPHSGGMSACGNLDMSYCVHVDMLDLRSAGASEDIDVYW
jgi:hypothetical protein